jgi:hypothetical protein
LQWAFYWSCPFEQIVRLACLQLMKKIKTCPLWCWVASVWVQVLSLPYQCQCVDAKKIKYVRGYLSNTIQCHGWPSKDSNRQVLTAPSTIPSTWSTWGLMTWVQ